MRINILAGGFGGSVSAMQTDLNRLHTNIESTIDDLKELNRKIRNVNGGVYNLESAVSDINRRIQTEEAKKVNLVAISQRISTFLSDAIQTDKAVASQVRQNQKAFLNDFPWLRPRDTNTEPSIWEQMAAAWNDFWGKAGDWVSDLVSNIVDYIKEHAVELIIGLVAIVIAAVLTYVTGGAFLAALGKLLLATVAQAAIGAVISGVIALFTGGDFWDAFGDGFAQGFMWGGIFAAIGSVITAIRGVIHGLRYADDVANVADDVAGIADDVAGTADDVAGVADDVAKRYPHSSLDDLQISDDFHQGFKEHIFEGQINGKGNATGLHYEGVDDVAGRVVDGTQTVINQYGAYDAQVIVNGVPKKVPSTFFPKNWTPQKVVDSIHQAFKNKRLVTLPGGGQQWVGVCDDGMEIVLGLRDGKIYTAWPYKPPVP